ncbi:Prefoldin [Jaminaea rosea]|uniref:Prefoldin n=1 Tax=Jaminaea rosea TaxID=1569628 RepID=A0A316UK38_9BASI|nr:Prefoldin [Jaminaea rosea]PWN24731.1 Prefoldin [Jaminaea rosea]
MASLDTLSAAYSKHQSTLQSLIEARQRLDSQLSENLQVEKDLPSSNANPEEEVVYKLVGGVLLKQEIQEAKADVGRRLEFIRGEIKRVEGQIGESAKEGEKVRGEVSARARDGKEP